jgi:hypothetical protein
MNAFATRIAVDRAAVSRTTDLADTPQPPTLSRWGWIRRAREEREADVRATPK